MLGPACFSLLLHPYLTPRVEKLIPESEFSQGVGLDPWQERAPCLPSDTHRRFLLLLRVLRRKRQMSDWLVQTPSSRSSWPPFQPPSSGHVF